MSREQHICDAITDRLKTLSGVRVYDQILIQKYETYQFDYVGVYGSTDERFTESLEDMTAVTNLGKIDVYIVCGNSVKKSPTVGKAHLRNAMQALCEQVEYILHNYQIERYQSDYEVTDYSAIHFIAQEPITFDDDETKGLSIMTFRIFYTKI